MNSRHLFAPLLLVIVLLAQTPRTAHAGDGVSHRVIYLVRHGQYDTKDESDPKVGRALVSLGIAQARLAGSRLREMPVEMTALLSSTLTRAHQTALVIQEDFRDLEVETTDLLCECTPATRRKDVMKNETPEDIAACTATLDEAFAKYFVPSPDDVPRYEIFVCHGNVIRYFVTKVLGVDTEAWLQMYMANCGITTVRVNSDGTMRLMSHNDVGHLPPNLRSGMPSNAKALEIPKAKKKKNRKSKTNGSEKENKKWAIRSGSR